MQPMGQQPQYQGYEGAAAAHAGFAAYGPMGWMAPPMGMAYSGAAPQQYQQYPPPMPQLMPRPMMGDGQMPQQPPWMGHVPPQYWPSPPPPPAPDEQGPQQATSTAHGQPIDLTGSAPVAQPSAPTVTAAGQPVDAPMGDVDTATPPQAAKKSDDLGRAGTR